jgi:hypothetical protein
MNLNLLWNDFNQLNFNKETKQGGNKKQTKPFYSWSAISGKNITAKHTDF